MSITDELREYADRLSDEAARKSEHGFSPVAMKLEGIADRIDAEHQKALDEWKAEHGQMWLKGYAECHAELLEGNETIAFDLAEHGWVRLPLDADGEYIRAGDVLDGYCKTIEVVEMRYGRSGWVLISRDGNAYADTFAFTHHHTPTVEDVLREFAERYLDYEGMPSAGRRGVGEALMDEYAARLRLAEKVDA